MSRRYFSSSILWKIKAAVRLHPLSNICYFCCENVFNSDFYEQLKKEFPGDDWFDKCSSDSSMGSNRDQQVVEDYVKQSPAWNLLIEVLRSRLFLLSVYVAAYRGIVRGRGVLHFVKTIVYTSLFGKGIGPTFVFRSTTSGGFLVPHTDVPRKVVSLLFYFPDDQWKDEYGGGTNFLVGKSDVLIHKWRNWSNKHISDEAELIEFRKDMEVVYSAHFLKNRMVGFVKSDSSWHEVPALNCSKGLRRKVFMMNINVI